MVLLERTALLEREDELALLRGCIAAASAGHGGAVAVCGEPGAGKSALVEAAYAEAPGLRVLRGGCDPLSTPRPLGPFRDISRAAGIGPLLAGDDLSRAHVCEVVFDALTTEPTVLVIEDLHWADAASVEVLRFLTRRVGACPLALLITYREEVGPQHSARPLLGDFAVVDGATTVRLAPLSVAAIGELLAGTPIDAARVHALTGGNAFFATEIAKDPEGPLPASVRDAVLARTVEVAPDDFEVLQLAAAAPDRLDDRVLPALGVDLPTLRRLYETGLLLRSRGGLVFRHELARLAVESTVPPGGAARLHARLLDALERIEPQDLAALTHHAVAAGDSRRAAQYADAAALEAARTGAHTEAVAFLETALAHLNGTRPAERAELLVRLGYEQYMTNRLDAAIDNVTSAFPLWREAGDVAGLSTAHDAVAVFEYYNAHRPAAEAYADRAADLAGSAAELAYGAARVTRAYLAIQRSDYEMALQCAVDGHRIAEEQASEALALRSETMSASMSLALHEAGAREQLTSRIEAACAAGLDELASTGYSALAYLDVEQRRLRAAEHVLEESIAFAVERDIPICHHWQTGIRSRLHLLQGRWRASLEDAASVLERSGMPLSLLWPHLVNGLLALRRDGSGGEHLEAAWVLAEQLDEPLRRLPVLSALAERMWLTGVPDDRVLTLGVAAMSEWSSSAAVTWALGDLAMWLRRLGLLVDPPMSVATQYRLFLAGEYAEAASWWGQAGAVFDEAMAYADAADPALRAQGVERLDLLGATALADHLRRRMRQQGLTNVPQRPRVSTRANPAGLTNRQLDVAKLVARGFSNNEIASRLYISPKTADHHVSAVLTKLGVPSRRTIVVQAEDLGL